jgi:hypothetical protein
VTLISVSPFCAITLLSFEADMHFSFPLLSSHVPIPFDVSFALPVYHVLLHLKSHIALGDFFRLVDDRPTAAALLEIYAREQDRAMLKDFYYQDDRRVANAALAMEDALRAKVRPSRLRPKVAASADVSSPPSSGLP